MSNLFHVNLWHPLLPFLLFIVSMGAQSIDFNNPSCPAAYNCGGVTIRYPFWGNDTHYCGYQGFRINCSAHDGQIDTPRITFGGDSYHVKSINYDFSSIVLIDLDFLNASNCTRVRHNISLEGLPLNFSTNSRNLSFHLNCTGGGNLPPFVTPIEGCLDYDGRRSFVSVMDSEEGDLNWECDEEVVTTVFPDADILLPGEWVTAVSRGFELNWWSTDGGCEKCEKSGGGCGQHRTSGFICFCPGGTATKGDCNGSEVNPRRLIVTATSAGVAIVLVVIILCNFIRKRKWRRKTNKFQNVELFLKNHEFLAPKRYSYLQVKKMTGSFKFKLGQGGFGTVYKGELSNGNLVAVKVLNELKGNGEDFINEVASVGQTSHVNIVSLVGFCFDGDKKALIYEYMPNGSLEKFIYSRECSGDMQLGSEKLLQISIGIARGLEYLHSGCNTRILHFDIKPHNILLDKDLYPKISDFGLAKLFPEEKSMISMSRMRGTPGYMAPELFSRNFGNVSQKSDVYSYGMMILEMVGGRKNIEVEVDHTSEIYFPHYIYQTIAVDEQQVGLNGTVSEENKMVKKMIIVGLWCIQTSPLNRPTITKVLEMLEGELESLEIPPKPYLSSPSRSARSTTD